jgi:hypothetical protein
MPYGAIIGGYRALFHGVSGVAEQAIRPVLVACVALPAILPVAALVLSIILLRRRADPNLELLTLATVAMVLTVFPRADVAHLAFVAALPYALTSAGVARLVPRGAATCLAICGLLFAPMFAANFFKSYFYTKSVAGVRIGWNDAPHLEALLAKVRPGSTLFVYPYMPIDYFITQAKNPTRFSFLAPGMMRNREASAALAELRSDPPRHILYMKLSRGEFLRVFPHATSLDWHFPELENWIEANYAPTDTDLWSYRLLERRTAFPPPDDPRVFSRSSVSESR